jgi:hypothetical protein
MLLFSFLLYHSQKTKKPSSNLSLAKGSSFSATGLMTPTRLIYPQQKDYKNTRNYHLASWYSFDDDDYEPEEYPDEWEEEFDFYPEDYYNFKIFFDPIYPILTAAEVFPLTLDQLEVQ